MTEIAIRDIAEPDFRPDVTHVEVRTDQVTIAITELPDGGLQIEAGPRQPSMHLTVGRSSHQRIERVTIGAELDF